MRKWSCHHFRGNPTGWELFYVGCDRISSLCLCVLASVAEIMWDKVRWVLGGVSLYKRGVIGLLVTHTGQTCTNTAGLAVSPLHGHGTMQQRPCTGRSPDLVLSPPRPHDRVASQGLERNVSPADWPATSIARCRQPPRHQLLRRQARSSLRPPFLLGTRPRAGSFCHASPSASRRGWGALHRTRSHLAYPSGLPA